MRYVCCTLVVCVVSGCQNQGASIRNPFLSPDRVPPPATRTLVPGTAQPYYPGDPVPNSPAVGVAPPTYVPGTPQPVVPSTPPGGWNGQPSANPASPYNVNPAGAELPVQVNGDDQGLRFAQSPTASAVVPSEQQTVVQAPYYEQQAAPQFSGQATGFQAPGASAQQVDSLHYAQPGAQRVPREVSIRPVSAPLTSVSSGDGFRPQGSRQMKRDKPNAFDSSGVQPIRSGVARSEFGPVREAVERFGFDPQYQWLRGQLQYLQSANQWQLRYIPVQGGADRFGGQVLIANPQVLGELRPGDYVQVRGQLTTQPTGTGALLPVYTVSVVQRQRVL